MVLRVKHLVLYPARFKQLGELLRLFNGDRTHQHGLTFLVALLHLVADRLQLAAHILVDLILVILAYNGLVCGNFDNVKGVYLTKLVLLRHSRTRHTRQLLIQTEEILERYGSKGLALAVYLNALLSLDSLVQTLVVAPSEHQTSRALIDNDYFSVLDNIVNIQFHDAVCTDSLIYVVQQRNIVGIHEVFHAEIILRLSHAARKKVTGLGLFIYDIVALQGILIVLLGIQLHHLVHGERFGKLVRLFVKIGGFLTASRNNKRGSRLVYENGVHLVHNGKIGRALNLVLFVHAHIIAQIIEAQFVVGSVGYVAGVCRAALIVVHIMDNKSHRKPEEAMNLCHKLTVALCKIVVYRYDMNAVSGERVEVGRKACNKGFALARSHFRDTSLMEHDTAYNLHRIMAYADNSVRGFAAHRKRVGQNIVQRFTRRQSVLKDTRLLLQLSIGHRLVFIFKFNYRLLYRLDPFQFS